MGCVVVVPRLYLSDHLNNDLQRRVARGEGTPMDRTILALDVKADADKLVEILSTTEGMRSVWTSNCDVADGKARFGFAMAPVDLDCTVEVVDGKSVRYTIESG